MARVVYSALCIGGRMDSTLKVMSDVILHMKYARFIPAFQRRETWDECITRNMEMHIRKYPQLEDEIRKAYTFVYSRQVLPSMRAIQFGGKPIELNASRNYNCSYIPVETLDAFSESMFLLLGGTGVGYSVQEHHVSKLPRLRGPVLATEDNGHKRRYLVGDSIEGWADAVKVLIESYFYGKKEVEFDFRDIRPKGAALVTAGGKAPGPQPLKDCVYNMSKVLDNAIAERGKNCKLKPIEAHSIQCHIADAVLAGGIRRAAMICLFSFADQEMMECKSGTWWEANPHFGRANNSVVMIRHKAKREDFDRLWKAVEASGSGEPGIFFSNDKEMGANPCQPSWAKVLTPAGIRTFAEIDVGSKIWSKDGWTTVVKKWSTGVKPIWKYQTTAGIFYGTENHKVLSGGVKVSVGQAKSIEQLAGPNPVGLPICTQDVMDGLVIGDGSVHKASNDLVLLHIGKKDTDYFESEIGPLIKRYRPGINKTAYEVHTTVTAGELPRTFERAIPKRYMDSPAKMAGFLRGLFTANGSIAGNRVTLKASSKSVIDDVQMMLSALGIRSYYTTNRSKMNLFSNGTYRMKESYDLNITYDKTRFMSVIGFIQKYKVPVVSNPTKSAKLDYNVIDSCVLGEEEVFDITVDNESHTYWTQGCNVSNCLEASLKPYTFCNLTTMNAADISSQEEFEARCKASAFISTLQASYTDFHYLREIWRTNTEKDALIGPSITGLASEWFLNNINLRAGAEVVLKENERAAKLLGINKAARTTLLKPDGTTSLLLGCSSGVHAWYAPYYLRRIRVGKNEAIYTYLSIYNPSILENDVTREDTAIICIPVKSPDGAITRNENTLDALARVKKFHEEWIQPGHRKGSNTHNVSVTVFVKPNEWDVVGDWMWENRYSYNGIAVLPYDNGTYVQPPFEEITEAEYLERAKHVENIDLSMVLEGADHTNLSGEIACAGGACEIK